MIDIDSVEALQERLAEIATELAQDERLLMAALANPFLALADLGYNVAPDVRDEIEDRARFTKTAAAKRRRIRSQIFESAGTSFDLQSNEDIAHVFGKPSTKLRNLLDDYEELDGTVVKFADRSHYDAIRSGRTPLTNLTSIRARRHDTDDVLAQIHRPRVAVQSTISTEVN